MSRRSFALASAAAALFTAGVALPALADDATEIKCEGVNSCKGQSACRTAENECAAKNSCKGKGFLMLSPEECDAAKARMAAEPAEPEKN